jgi:hypothetical protein
LAAVLLAGDGIAQPRKDDATKSERAEEDRNRTERGDRRERPPRMSAEQRERLRQDIQDADKQLKRKKSE